MKLKIFRDSDKFQVWLDEDDFEDKTGVCIGSGKTRRSALQLADKFIIETQKRIKDVLNNEPAPECYELEP